jgi:hypothetical protein
MSKSNLLRKKLGDRKSTRQMYAGQRTNQPIDLATLRLDGGTQPRERFDEEILKEYAEKMLVDDRGLVLDHSGQAWEPIVVYEDGDDLWLADGFHRVRAARSREIAQFQARVIVGSQRDAVKFSLSANARHGLRRTNADKRRAVARALKDEEWANLSARAIAEICSVSDFMVRQVRGVLADEGAITLSTQRLGADGKLHDVSTRQAAGEATTKAKTRRPRLKFSDTSKLARVLSARTLKLDELDSTERLTKSECILAYPSTSVHYDALKDHLPRLLKRRGTLIIPFEQGRSGLMGPGRLDPLVESKTLSPPRWVVIQDTQQVALVWSVQRTLQSWAKNLGELVESINPGSTTLLTLEN